MEESQAHHRRGKQRVLIPIIIAIVVAGGGGLWWYASSLTPKRFDTVVPDRLYRSGEASAAQLEHLRDTYGIDRVVCLLNADAEETRVERAAARELGLEWVNIPMRGNGASTPEARARLVEVLTDPNAPPTLVHCAAGVNRTGLAVGLYRIHVDGWDYEKTLDELRSHGFEDLPKHENLRAALREAAGGGTTQPATPAGSQPVTP